MKFKLILKFKFKSNFVTLNFIYKNQTDYENV